jgi:hypothetical protein
MAPASSSTEVGFTCTAAEPATSGSEEVLEQITGMPRAMASTTGSPKPS